ncbi:MAG: mechanosensitive ion channel domain-containing protein, partial [Bacteroidia bacterium]
VQDMTLRQTTIESDEGKIVLVPNSMIINNPLSKYFTDNDVSQEFSINVDVSQVRVIAALIVETIHDFDIVLNENGKKTKAVADSLSGDKIKLNIIFWLDVSKLKGSRSEARSAILLSVFDKLNENGYKFSG